MLTSKGGGSRRGRFGALIKHRWVIQSTMRTFKKLSKTEAVKLEADTEKTTVKLSVAEIEKHPIIMREGTGNKSVSPSANASAKKSLAKVSTGRVVKV